jgi:putative DNA primase/helicase
MNQELLHDGSIDLAVAKRRTEKRWRNTKITWSALVTKLASTHRTHETLRDYLKATKERQDQIKDIGGFVGGYLKNGHRKNGNVRHRQLITLDIDLASPEFWSDLQLAYEHAALVYSTHKHQPESPRLRLLMPLDRPVSAEEYEAISRRIAGNLGIDQFDHTTFQPARLMYWPSTSKDGEYLYEHQDGPWLKADEILASYVDWTDSSEWPVGTSESEHVRRGIRRAGDPLEKPGIVGAFCRTYSIATAIVEYLGDRYDATDQDDRYTYRHGSTAAGLVIYDDKYAYSHHGTDPTSGKLCNAFDLVRLHLYGEQDDETSEEVPVNKRPSYKAMATLATQDANVRRQMGQERLERAKDDFGSDPEGDVVERGTSAEETSWLEHLDMDDRGNYRRTLENIITILENDPKLKGRIVHNAFTDKDLVIGQLPWRKVQRDTRYFTDIDIIGTCHYLEKVYGIDHKAKTTDALEAVLYRHRYHPVRDYLQGLEWDGQLRIERLLVDYLGAEDHPYVHAATRKTLVAAVARIMNPGVKFDYVLTLVGCQGAGKSTILRKLGREWYCENLTTVQGKDASEQLRGVWIMEMGELAGLKKAEVEIIKNFISRQEDSYRPAYGIKKETYPRQCVFIGTTNNNDFLRDPTGNRRFWPVALDGASAIYDVHRDLDQAVVDQLWAEAVTLYDSGEALYLDEELEAYARQVQEEHSERDARFEVVQKYLEMPLPENWEDLGIYERRAYLAGDELQPVGHMSRDHVTIAEIWCEALGKQIGDMTTHNTKPLHDIMRKMPGWNYQNSKKRIKVYGCHRYYQKSK